MKSMKHSERWARFFAEGSIKQMRETEMKSNEGYAILVGWHPQCCNHTNAPYQSTVNATALRVPANWGWRGVRESDKVILIFT